MPDLISFEQCIARPDRQDNKYPLIRHLINAGLHQAVAGD